MTLLRLTVASFLAASALVTATSDLAAQQFQLREAAVGDSLARLAAAFVDSAEIPLQFEQDEVRLPNPVQEQDLRAEARRVAGAMIFPRREGTSLELVTVADAALTESQLDQIAGNLLEYGLIGVGYSVADVVWTLPGGRTVGTLATVDRAGDPRFEPVLYLSGLRTESGDVQRGSWISRQTRRITNGFGITCVDVQWNVDIATNGGQIVDPEPHIVIERQLSNCPFWEQETTYGEALWCRPGGGGFPDCMTPGNESGEHCIDWVVATYVVTGFSDIEVDTNVGGSYQGIETKANIKFRSARFGSEGTFGTKGRLCAIGGPE